MIGYETHIAKVSTKVMQETFPNSSAIIDSHVNINYGVRTFGGAEKLFVESIDIIE